MRRPYNIFNEVNSMKKYFPVIFTKEDVGFSTSAIDLEGCFSQGDTFEEAYQYTKDAIGLFLEDCENFKTTDIQEIIPTLEKGQFVCVVEFDETEYLKKNHSKSVKKTLTIPEWLNEEAEKQHVNFSGVLQEALIAKLSID